MASIRYNVNKESLLLLLLHCFFLFSHCSSPLSHATDTIAQGQSLLDGQTIVSAGRIFELGFFSPGKSTSRYVGIWYHDISPLTVAWVANREHPLPDSSGSFTVGSDGNLLALDGKSNTIWSSNASMMVPNNSFAQLTDAGNLVLCSSGGGSAGNMGSVVWQSFDHPTDTHLPGMKYGLDLRTGVNEVFTSWKSPDDPSPGNFSNGIDPHGSTQVFVWEGSEPYWRSGMWNGIALIGIPNQPYLHGFKLHRDQKMYYTYTASPGALVRFVVSWYGDEQCFIWLKDAKVWNPILSLPSGDECEIYNRCGAHGVCSYSSSGIPMCSCLRGFEPRYVDEWNIGNWRGGCIRRTPLGCGRNSTNSTKMDQKEDGFLRLEGMKLPDFSNGVANYLYASGCEDDCLKNCSCMAYAFFDGMGCFVWDRELVDLYQFSSGGYTLYLRLAGSELDERRSTFKIIILVAPLGAIILTTFSYILWRWKKKAKDHLKKESEREMLLFDLGFSEEVATEILASENSRDGNRRKVPELVLFNFNTISLATNNFCDSNKLGEGGFGAVYKGKLPDGREIAVKRLSKSSEQGLEELKNEVTLIARLQHRNLVRLLGCCIQGEEKILLYEYMPNKSLDAFVFGSMKQALLDWGNRFSIIQGIARGLLYIHEDSRLRIVHRDLKTSNILLDEAMNPKISDFGIAKIFGGDQNQEKTKRVVGTYGYMSPEYAMKGLFSMKSDIYSFGVILLEVISGKKNNTFWHYETSQNLLSYAWQLWKEGRAGELIDPSMEDTCSPSEVLRCIQVGLLCVQDHPDDRPTMSLVVLMLGSDTSIQTIPKQPTFTNERRSSRSDPSMTNLEAVTENSVTITAITGR